ncbi:MAG: dTMP kinase [Planctomycetales bacterium 12-60-4]|nr:MAG: dTMP kinase [Planctomycetales bacterium 12-60-4]
MAFLIAVEGIDGSGKGTQSARLVENLRQRGLRAELISFPRYRETEYGRKIGDFLNGRFGRLDQVHPLLVSLLFAGDRLESRGSLVELLATNDVVVCDRYVASNAAHQGAKAVNAEREELLRWIEFVEYDQHQLPRPDLTVWLDIPVSVAQALIQKKAQRSYTDLAADLQEADAAYLQRVANVYAELAEHDATWRRIEVVENNQPRPVDTLAEEVLQTVSCELDRRRNAIA